MALKQKKLFNPNGDDTKSIKRLIGGDSTNIQEFSNPKYEVMTQIYDMMMASFWIPKEVPISTNKKDYDNLDEKTRETFDKMISFLVFLDSLQMNNIPNINNYITASEVNLCLAIQAMQEAVHSESYSYILLSLIDESRRSEVLNQWRDDKYLLERNNYVGSMYNSFVEYPSTHNLIRVIFFNYVLESIFFYSNFCFFFNQQRLGRLGSTAKIIAFIKRDENNHVVLFQNMIRILQKENSELFTEEFTEELRNIIVQGVEQEKAWARYAIGDHIEGLSSESVCEYVEYLGNLRLEEIGMKPISSLNVNPLPWVDLVSNDMVYTDYFEQRNSEYSQSASVYDDL